MMMISMMTLMMKTLISSNKDGQLVGMMRMLLTQLQMAVLLLLPAYQPLASFCPPVYPSLCLYPHLLSMLHQQPTKPMRRSQQVWVIFQHPWQWEYQSLYQYQYPNLYLPTTLVPQQVCLQQQQQLQQQLQHLFPLMCQYLCPCHCLCHLPCSSPLLCLA